MSTLCGLLTGLKKKDIHELFKCKRTANKWTNMYATSCTLNVRAQSWMFRKVFSNFILLRITVTVGLCRILRNIKVTSRPPGGLQISNTCGQPPMSFKQLSQLDRLCTFQPQYRIGINCTFQPQYRIGINCTSVLAVI